MKRKNHPQRFRKRPASPALDLDSRSGVLRNARDHIQKRRYRDGLLQLDREIVGTSEPDYQARLLALAGDTLLRQGKFAEAAAAFSSVEQVAVQHPASTLRAAVGEVTSLLKNVQVAEAQERAFTAVQTALEHQQAYREQLVLAQATLAAGGEAVIPPEPPTPAQTANRLAGLFFAEGEIATAKALYQQGLQLSPHSTHARLGLARIALREDAPAEAERLAREALTLGQYRARTIDAWAVLLAATRMSGTSFDVSLLSGLAQATPTVRARAVLIIARGLRSQGDSRWEQISNDWLQQFGATNPNLAAEFRKLRLAQRRITNAPAPEQLQAAQQLLQTPNLSPVEWLGAAKQVIGQKIRLNQPLELPALLTQVGNRFGANQKARYAHGLALALKQAGRIDLAQTLWQENVTSATGEVKRKSIWALARLQSEQNDHVAAAQQYWNYSQDATAPQRFRLYALLAWTREIAASNQPELLAQARPQIEAALPQITDYELVLDLSRQVRVSRLSKTFALQLFQHGERLALQAFDACDHPAPAVTVLFKLCRRANDHQQYAAMIATWTRLTEIKKQWLWSESGEYWQWLELVFRAYRNSNMISEAESFVAPLLIDPATPLTGYVSLAVSYAAMKRKLGDFATMFDVYERMINLAPAHEWTSVAYYWFAVRALKQGNSSHSVDLADRMLIALGKDRRMIWKNKMAAAALCIKAGLDISQIPPQTDITTVRLQAQAQEIQTDLNRLAI